MSGLNNLPVSAAATSSGWEVYMKPFVLADSSELDAASDGKHSFGSG